MCVDEAVFTFNTFKKRAWFSKFDNLKVRQDKRRIKTQALIAAIESDRGLVAHAIHADSIDSEKFVAFLHDLRLHMSCGKFGLFLDNLSVHKTKRVKHVLEELQIIPIFNVPYSPDFNGIESYFSLVKAEYKTLLLDLIMRDEEVDTVELVTKSLYKIDRKHIQK